MTVFSHRRYFVDFHCKITGITGDPFLPFLYQKLLFHNPKFLLKTVFSQFILCLYNSALFMLDLRLVKCTSLGSKKMHAGRSQHRIVNTILGHIYVLSSDKSLWNK